MQEFTPIVSQEQFDAAIGERIKRERDTLTKRYGDYEELREKVSTYEKRLGEMSASMEESSKKYAGYDKTIEELNSKVKGYETGSVKLRIAHEECIPYELASRLCGETEDDIRKDARSIAGLIQKQEQSAPLKSYEPTGVNAKTAALKSLTENLINKGE